MSKFYCFKTLSCCHAVWIQIRTYNLGPNYLHGMMFAVIEWGGGGYVLVVKFSRGGLCPSCKIHRGGLCPSCKIHGGDFVHVYKNEQGGFCPGGFCPTPLEISCFGLIIFFMVKLYVTSIIFQSYWN